MVNEVLEALVTSENGTFVDLTFGSGGHTRAILERLSRKGRVFAFDQDPEAADRARDLADDRCTFILSNYRFARQFLEFHDIHQVDGMLLDLGVSSPQIDSPQRGFSTRMNGPLDMRMDPSCPRSAADIIQSYSEEALAALLKQYGNVGNARVLAKKIVQVRATQSLCTTQALRAVLQPFAPKLALAKYAAKVFQALRIEVNDELNALESILMQSIELVKPSGRLVTLAYHSLEDRPIKHFLRAGNLDDRLQKDAYGNVSKPFVSLYRKAIRPTESEVLANNRSRSARLRAGERIHKTKVTLPRLQRS